MPAVQAVILFTDLVGSTELSSRLDAAAAETLRQTHLSLLRQAVAAHDGTEVKNLGDGLMVAFSSPSAALACAVAIQQGIEAHNRSALHPLGVRIGLSAGEATFEDGDYFGDPVVEAARLCARAEGGQILATDLVRANAGRRATQSFVLLGEVELKGLPEPVLTVEVVWEPLAASSVVPLPARLQSQPEVGFFGRGAELAALSNAFKAVAAEDGRRVVLISGEPGIGKTTLAATFARSVHAQGAVVLYGRCDEELGLPYQPIAEALAHYVSHAPGDVLAAHVAEHGSDLVALAPELAGRLGALPAARSVDPDTQRFLLFAAAVALLGGASAAHPVVVLLDDLHWADKPTLSLLRYLVSASEPMRLVVVGTYRQSELSRGHPLSEALVALRRDQGVDRLELGGLEDTEVVALMESGAGHELDRAGVALAHALRRDTDGNPFFVLELLRHLAERGFLYQDEDGRWQARPELDELGMPQSVREVVGHRVARLGERAEELLKSAAVVGRDFDVEVLGMLSGVSEDELVDVLDRAVAAALVTDLGSGRYSFAHAVIQHTLYDGLSPTRRQLTHRRVAEALEGLYGAGPGPRVGELARHWLTATRPSDVTKALDYARWAGEDALARLAPEEAVRWFSQALELADHQPGLDQHLRTELLIGLGNAQRLVGEPAYRETLLEAAHLAESLGDTDRLVRAVLANNRGTLSQVGAVDAERVATLEAALAVTAGDSHERARLLATLAAELTEAGDWSYRRSVAQQAVSMARRLSDPDTLARVLNLLFFCLCVPETLEERLVTTAEAVGLADGLADAALQHWAHRYHVYACAEAGDVDGIDAHLPAVIQTAAAVGDPSLVWAATFIRSGRTILAGNLEEAEVLATEALHSGTSSGMPEAEWVFAMQLLAIRGQQGRLAEIEESFARAAEESPNFPLLRAVAAGMHCELSNNDDARALFSLDAADDFASFSYGLGWLYGLVAYADVCARLAEIEPAGRLYEQLGPWHRQCAFVSAVAPLGAVALYLGMLATVLTRYDDAEAHFAEAMEIHERLRAPYWIARTRLEWARLLLARRASGDAARARALLEEVRATAAQYGFAALERHAAGLSTG